MDVDSIRDPKVRRAFPEGAAASADRFFEHLLSRLDAMTDAIRRDALLLLVFGGLHYLLIRTGIDKASIGGFELTDLSLPRTILPAVIAFVYYEMMGSLAVINELQELCASLFRLTHPLVWREGFLPTMFPPQPAMFGSELEPLKGIAIVKVARVFQILTQSVLVSAPLIYVGWAAWLELTEFGAPGWEELVAVAVAVLFLVYGIILLIAGAQISGMSHLVPGKVSVEDSTGQSP